MPVGPLAVSDEVSLSLMQHVRRQTEKDLMAEGKEIPHNPANAVIDAMLEKGRPGRAGGGGFYEYPKDAKKHLWSGLSELFPQADHQLDQAAMIERLLFIQAVETARCIEENVVLSVADANIGSIFGWGFAAHKGGTAQFINDYGVRNFVDRAKVLATTYGERFAPPALLVRMAEAGETFPMS
jgi:3-hydroxyacyl-CoA dehydrogenase/enoyl-CoA hydratase/3-hydroxybutyryl-CoA epimerase